jgi:hypothetical protein
MRMAKDEKDQDIHKGAVEDDSAQPGEHNTSMRGQNPHRGGSEQMIRGEDTDYPEPGSNAEHTGEPEEDPEQSKDMQISGERQKTDHNWQKEDPLAS